MTTETAAPLPTRLPLMEGYTKEFYEWCKKRELRFQRCSKCGTWRHVPRPMCGTCHSMDWAWTKTAGTGTIYCWTIVHKALHPAFANDVPYAPAIVGLDEGPRIPSWVTGISPDKFKVGMKVSVWFDDVTDSVTLPKFKPAS
jgi:uncharacterized OB-fold protein